MSDVDLLVLIGDIHGGSSVAICPPKGIEHDDGGRYLPSRPQVWIWKEFCRNVERIQAVIESEKPRSVTVGVNGDAVDGYHHPKSNAQYISPLESIHVRIAHHVLTHLFDAVSPTAIHITRGTGSHVGKAGTLEEGLARVLRDQGYPLIEDPDTGQVTSYWRRYDVGGLRVDQRHHGRMGQRSHTRNSYLTYYAQDIEFEYRDDGERPPDLAIRSHYHVYGDSGRPYKRRTRVIALPCLQLATEFTHRIAAERLADIGLVVVTIRDGRDDVIPLLAKPKRPTLARSTA